jgi:ABC-type Zn uptake system ZnuABC Zn-binding protein ZnuA
MHWFLIAMFLLLTPTTSLALVRVVTTTPIHADLVSKVGGEHVEVESLMRGPENPHNVIPKPSFIIKLRKADLFVHTGLDGEPWVPVLLKSARRDHLFPGGPGYVDLSKGIVLKEVPKRGELSRAQGDIHVYGNPHYALDPLNGIKMARTIAEALARVDPDHREAFDANYQDFSERMQQLVGQRMHLLGDQWVSRLEPHGTVPVATYHRAWSYFLDRFFLEQVAEVEPKPGIAPGPKHLAACVERMKANGARIVALTTFSNQRNGELVAQRAGGRALVLAQEVHALPGVDGYEELFEYNVEALLAVYRELGL